MKRLLFILMAAVMLLSFLTATAFAANESASPKPIPRVVSIVFDDSGSMYENTDRWAYANYAMQAFTAMMGSEDALHITFINLPKNDKNVNLSKESKQGEINGLGATMFGGGTENVLASGVQKLADEYKRRKGEDAKYYLVVMADGDLDISGSASKTKVSVELPKIVSIAKNGGSEKNGKYEYYNKEFSVGSLEGADFTTIYFSMKDDEKIDGIDCYYAPDENKIVERLKQVSEQIMGRTDVTNACDMSDGKITVTLPYPSHSITVFAQKTDNDNDGVDSTVFNNVNIAVSKNGSAVDCIKDTYYVKCPEDVDAHIRKNRDGSTWPHKDLETHLGGFVTLITDKSQILSKGEYVLDVSQYGLTKDDIIVMLEPAVRIGCKYAVGESEEYRDFSEIKENLRAGDSITIKCGLYELNPDGTLGNEVSGSVLSPSYEFFINNVKTELEKLQGGADNNSYRIQLVEDHAGKELKVTAVLTGYKAFELKEQFGEIPEIPVLKGGAEVYESEISFTKLDAKELLSSGKTVEIPFEIVNSEMLNRMHISIDGCNAFKSGACSSLRDCVKIAGNNVVYTFALNNKKTEFSSLPKEFTVALSDGLSAGPLARIKVNVIQPEYKISAENGFEDEALNIGMLESNDTAVKFTILADYEGDGEYVEIDSNDLKSSVKDYKAEKGGFSGKEKKDGAVLSFTPEYKGNEKEEFFKEPHTVYASAVIDGKKITSEKLEFSISKPKYKLEAQNNITSSLTLNSLKSNTEKVVFVLTADYDGDGEYEPISEKDLAEYKNITVKNETLPGKTAVEYEDGKPSGVSFTPFYDEKKNKNTDLHSLADKNHVIIAHHEKLDASAEVELSVSSVSYRIDVNNEITEGTLSLESLKSNQNKIIFTVVADYEGTGENFQPLEDWDSKIYDGLKIETNGLCGKIEKEYDSDKNVIGISFTPAYNEKTDKEPLGSFTGKTYEIKAFSEEKGISNFVSISIGSIDYIVEAQSFIEAPLTLDSIKENTQKILFTVRADYDGKGSYTTVEKWDTGVYDRLLIDNGSLPGTTAIEYDKNGNPIGKSFTPVYDENDNGGVAFTEVAGKNHTIRGYLSGTDKEDTEIVVVEPPVYDVKVIKDGITLVDVKLKKNKEGVVFEISRNNRVLNAKELEGLKPYVFAMDKNSDRVVINTEPLPNPDGTAFLSCIPTYNGWFNPFSLFIKDGDMQITLTVANASDTANIHINTDYIYWSVFGLGALFVLVGIWIVICFVTRMRFTSGYFYRVTFTVKPGGKWKASGFQRIRSNKGRIGMFFNNNFKCFVPFSNQKKKLSILAGSGKAVFETEKNGILFDVISLPHWKLKLKKGETTPYRTGALNDQKIYGIITRDKELDFSGGDISGSQVNATGTGEFSIKMDANTFIAESGKSTNNKKMIFFLSDRKYRELKKMFGNKKHKP